MNDGYLKTLCLPTVDLLVKNLMKIMILENSHKNLDFLFKLMRQYR